MAPGGQALARSKGQNTRSRQAFQEWRPLSLLGVLRLSPLLSAPA